MLDRDYTEFSAMLDSVAGLLTRGAYTPNASNSALYFRSLQRHDVATIRAAFDAHVRDTSRGRFMPTPADILAQIEAMTNDGRPGPEEAWAMVPTGEDQTVVWTTEMAEAYGACSTLLASGDRIGARMTFKEVYERLVDQAKRAGKRAVWQASLGSDMDKRKRALTAAIEAGRMTAEGAHEACPALPMPETQLAMLPAPECSRKDAVRQKLRDLAEAKRGDPADPLAWAKRLREREQSGVELSAVQRNAWRNALDVRQGDAPGTFAQIPNDVLPPGMRRQRSTA